jgi:c-di-AMP phosphodiesterase-like protein
MFLEDFEHDREVQRLVDNTDFLSYIFAIASDKDDSGKIYDVEDIAKTADYLLKYRVNATFAIARIDEETIAVSARSKGVIDVSSIMKLLGGGGNEHSAAAKIKGKSIEEVKEFLYKLLIPTNYLQDDNISQRIVEIEETSKDSESIQGNILKLTI